MLLVSVQTLSPPAATQNLIHEILRSAQPRITLHGELTVSSVQPQVSLILQLVQRRTTLTQSMILFMRWQETRLDMEKLLRDFLRDTSDRRNATYKLREMPVI